MLAFEFLQKDNCSKNKIYIQFTKSFKATWKGYVTPKKFYLICKNNPTEDTYKLFKDWISTNRFENMTVKYCLVKKKELK